jgi:hypothetical protein
MPQNELFELVKGEAAIGSRNMPLLVALMREVNKQIALSGAGTEFITIHDTCDKLYDAIQALPEDVQLEILETVGDSSDPDHSTNRMLKTYTMRFALVSAGIVLALVVMFSINYLAKGGEADGTLISNSLTYIIEILKIILGGTGS